MTEMGFPHTPVQGNINSLFGNSLFLSIGPSAYTSPDRGTLWFGDRALDWAGRRTRAPIEAHCRFGEKAKRRIAAHCSLGHIKANDAH